MPRLQLASDLVAEALFGALREAEPRSPSLVREWHAEREPLYGEPAGPARERAFAELERRWLARLRLAAPLERALEACPCVRARVESVIVRRALRARDEGAELLVSRERSAPTNGAPPPARVVMGIRTRRLLRGEELLELALVELLRVEDMLDPRFGYQPDPSLGLALEPWQRELARDRLAVLWSARIRGRMLRVLGRSEADEGPDEAFRKAFRGLSETRLTALHRAARSGATDTFEALIAAASERSPAAEQGCASKGE